MTFNGVDAYLILNFHLDGDGGGKVASGEVPRSHQRAICKGCHIGVPV